MTAAEGLWRISYQAIYDYILLRRRFDNPRARNKHPFAMAIKTGIVMTTSQDHSIEVSDVWKVTGSPLGEVETLVMWTAGIRNGNRITAMTIIDRMPFNMRYVRSRRVVLPGAVDSSGLR